MDYPSALPKCTTRFAPSPSGDLHLGGVYTALGNFVLGDTMLIRVDDLDVPRVVAGAQARIFADLTWLGLAPNSAEHHELVCVQSARINGYVAALQLLRERGLVYPCDCSRSDIAALASAPHDGEELVYPGTCAAKDLQRALKKAPALRVRVPQMAVRFSDVCTGTEISQQLAAGAGDFVLQRADGIFAYHFTSALDDAALAVNCVLRGRDLQLATPRQRWLQQVLGYSNLPEYGHLGLILDAEGSRLQKRKRPLAVIELRNRGVKPELLIGVLAHALGLLGAPESISALELRRARQLGQLSSSWRIADLGFAPKKLELLLS